MFLEINISYRGKGLGKKMMSLLFSKLASIYPTFYFINNDSDDDKDIFKNCCIKSTKSVRLNIIIDSIKTTFFK